MICLNLVYLNIRAQPDIEYYKLFLSMKHNQNNIICTNHRDHCKEVISCKLSSALQKFLKPFQLEVINYLLMMIDKSALDDAALLAESI